MITDELLPCPFCGSEAERCDVEDREDVDNTGASYIECTGCGACTQLHFDRKENLIGSWNNRAAAALGDGAVDQCSHPWAYQDQNGVPFCGSCGECWSNVMHSPATKMAPRWQPIATAPKDGRPIEVCNTRHPSHAPVIVRWTDEGLSEDLPEPHWCDAATADGSALYFNQNFFDFWKPTTTLPAVPATPQDSTP